MTVPAAVPMIAAAGGAAARAIAAFARDPDTQLAAVTLADRRRARNEPRRLLSLVELQRRWWWRALRRADRRDDEVAAGYAVRRLAKLGEYDTLLGVAVDAIQAGAR